jgi:serine/threonine-protein kinase ATR
LIPHIVLGILRNGTVEGKKAVSTEIHAVLEGAASDAGHFGKHREVMQLATQQIFTLIDILTAWADTKRREEKARRRAEANRAAAAGGTPAPSSRPKRSSEEAKDTYVEEFLSSIPQSTLAKAAFRCKAYVRALRHFEQNIRRQPRQGFVVGNAHNSPSFCLIIPWLELSSK